MTWLVSVVGWGLGHVLMVIAPVARTRVAKIAYVDPLTACALSVSHTAPMQGTSSDTPAMEMFRVERNVMKRLSKAPTVGKTGWVAISYRPATLVRLAAGTRREAQERIFTLSRTPDDVGAPHDVRPPDDVGAPHDVRAPDNVRPPHDARA